MSERSPKSPEKRPARVSDQIVDFFLGLVWGGDPQDDYKYWGDKVNSLFRLKRKKPRK